MKVTAVELADITDTDSKEEQDTATAVDNTSNIPQVKIYSVEELWLQYMHIIGRDTPYTCTNHAKSELQWQRMETFSATLSFIWHHPRNHKLSWVDLGFRCMDTQVK